MLSPLPALFAKRLLDSMSESVVVLDAQYVITYWNRAAALLQPYSSSLLTVS